MRLTDLNEGITFKKDGKVETTCQYFSKCGIPFDKEFREDGTGADFTMKNFKIAKEAVKSIKTKTNICKNFDIVLEKGSNTIKVYFK